MTSLATSYAKRWEMTPEQAQEWLDLEDSGWAVTNAATLHRAGLSAADGLSLYRQVDKAVVGHMARLVNAGRMASLNTRYLHWWAMSGLLRPVTADRPIMNGRRPPPPSFTAWVTAARQFIAGCAGDEELAALAAASGLSAPETAEMYRAGTLDRQSLLTLAALRATVPPT